MDKPLRLQVLEAMTAWLQGITPANDYEFDLSQSVFRGRKQFGQEMSVPAISILESPRPDIGVYTGVGRETRKEDWLLLIQGWVDDDAVNPTDPAYYLAAAVEHRLAQVVEKKPGNGKPAYPEIYRFGELITDMELSPSMCLPPQEQLSARAFFYLPVRVGLALNVGQPYVKAGK